MSKHNVSDGIYDQLAEAATAFVMEQYGTAMEENIAAEQTPPDEIPAELDKRCRRLIRKHLARARRSAAKQTLRKSTRVAVLSCMLLCSLVTILYATVDAVRLPINRFFIHQQKEYMEFSATDPSGTSETPLSGLVPESYDLVQNYAASTGDVFIQYQDLNGDRIEFSIVPPGGVLLLDSEDAELIENLTIASCDAILVVKDCVQIVWMDTETGNTYHLFATALSREEMIVIAEKIGTPPVPET